MAGRARVVHGDARHATFLGFSKKYPKKLPKQLFSGKNSQKWFSRPGKKPGNMRKRGVKRLSPVAQLGAPNANCI